MAGKQGAEGTKTCKSRPSVAFPSFPASSGPARRLEGHRDPDSRLLGEGSEGIKEGDTGLVGEFSPGERNQDPMLSPAG